MPAIGRIKQVLLKAIGKSGQLGCDFCKTLACSSFQLDSAQSKITNRVAYGFLFGEIQPVQFPAFINALEPGKQVAILTHFRLVSGPLLESGFIRPTQVLGITNRV